MNTNEGTTERVVGCLIVAGAAGLLGAVLLWLLGGWSFMQGAFMGFVVATVVGALTYWVMMRPLPPLPRATPEASAPEEEAQPEPAAAPVAEATPAPAAPTPAAAPATQDAAPKTAAAPEPAADARPAAFSDGPQGGTADDLKLIGGVGPKLEETLNALGIWHFEQVAALSQSDIAWVDERLRFKGRIERDNWVGQARTLAEGGETEFSKKKRKS